MVMLMHSPLAIVGLEIGVCNGMKGNDLPSSADVIGLYKQCDIGKIRLFDPNPSALEALRGSNICVTSSVQNEDVPNLASGIDAANSEFDKNMGPYISNVKFEIIAVANEVIPGNHGAYVLSAIRNLDAVLDSHSLHNICVKNTVSASVLRNSYPPSATEFTPEALDTLVDILNFSSTKSSSALMVNLYPYFAYAAGPANVRRLIMHSFTATEPVVHEGSLDYYNLLDDGTWGFLGNGESKCF